MTKRERVLIGAPELMGLLHSADRPAILDVRWRLDVTDGRPDYLAGHLPGAVYVSLEDELSDHGVMGRGRHPLPSGAAVQAAARRWGLRRDRPVVVYDDWNRAGSARAWWVLTAAGIPGVRILDGGLGAWMAAGGELDQGAVDPPAGDVTVTHNDLYAGACPARSADEVAGATAGTLLDARAPARFRGDVEPVDRIAGHIPGACNLPSTAVLAADGTFLPRGELAALFGPVPDGVCVYCGSGVTASVVIAALQTLGNDAALFPGSWSQWSSEADRAVATGA